jgi:hypothetical protein
MGKGTRKIVNLSILRHEDDEYIDLLNVNGVLQLDVLI